MTQRKSPFKRHCFPREIILLAARWDSIPRKRAPSFCVPSLGNIHDQKVRLPAFEAV